MTIKNLETISAVMTVLQLTLLHRRQVGVYLPEQKLCFVEVEKGEVILSPIGEEIETFDFNPKIEDVFIPSYSQELGQINPSFTLSTPSFHHNDILSTPYLRPKHTLINSVYLLQNGAIIDFKEGRTAEVIADKLDEGDLQEKAFEFENLILAKLNLEGSMASYSTAHKNFTKYQGIIADSEAHKLSRLRKVSEDVKKNTAKLVANKQTNYEQTGALYMRKKITSWSVAVIAFLVVLFIAYKIISATYFNDSSAVVKTENVTITALDNKRPNTIYRIEKVITEFEKDSGVSISPWRQGKIKNEINGVLMSDSELDKFVREFAVKTF